MNRLEEIDYGDVCTLRWIQLEYLGIVKPVIT